jgi:2'-5' RNA ligase
MRSRTICTAPSRPALRRWILSPAKGAHVTLARFRKHARPSDGRAVEQSLAGSDLASLVLHDEARELQLFESQLGPGGPTYSTTPSVRRSMT